MSLLVVCEGLDGAGKTSAIEQLLKDNNNFAYSKGIGSDTYIGKIARKHPSTFMFLSELIYVKYKIIKPNLRKNKIILQDRYDASVLAYPTAEKYHNKLIGKILKSFLIKPDALAYFDVSLEERIKRLASNKKNKYHVALSKDPDLIISRENKYLDLYRQFNGPKTKINTTNKSVKEAAEILEEFIWKIAKK